MFLWGKQRKGAQCTFFHARLGSLSSGGREGENLFSEGSTIELFDFWGLSAHAVSTKGKERRRRRARRLRQRTREWKDRAGIELAGAI